MQIEVNDLAETVELATIKVFDIGIGFMHNYPCTVCRKNKAILNCSTGVMEPCSRCARMGWQIKVNRRKFKKFLKGNHL